MKRFINYTINKYGDLPDNMEYEHEDMDTDMVDPDKETITPIGTLEWSMEGGGVYAEHLTSIRPTIDEDVDGKDVLIAKSYVLNIYRTEDEFKRNVEIAMTYVINGALRHLQGDGFTGKVLLVLKQFQLHWDFKIVCYVYEV